MKTFTLINASFLAFLFLLFVSLSTNSFAQDKETKLIETIGQKGTGDDPDIKSKSKINDPNANMDIPSWKSGEGIKGPGAEPCYIICDNWTPWYLDIYVDGIYHGTLAPWEKKWTFTGSGYTKIKGIAEMPSGNYVYWGPEIFYCPKYEEYTWRFKKPSE